MARNMISEEKLMKEILLFRQSQQTFLLASCSESHKPLASYAPFVEDEKGRFYCLLSDMANHSQNLKEHELSQSMLSVLFIEDEAKSRNIFARQRLNYQCTVKVLSRRNPLFNKIIEQLQIKFGKTIELLASLGDFNLFCLTPRKGNYVKGFGQAYELKDAKIPVITNI